jgi:hypothetical protein
MHRIMPAKSLQISGLVLGAAAALPCRVQPLRSCGRHSRHDSRRPASVRTSDLLKRQGSGGTNLKLKTCVHFNKGANVEHLV